MQGSPQMSWISKHADFKAVLEEYLEMQQVKGRGLPGCQSTGGQCSSVPPCPALLSPGQPMAGSGAGRGPVQGALTALHCTGQCQEGSPVCKIN